MKIEKQEKIEHKMRIKWLNENGEHNYMEN